MNIVHFLHDSVSDVKTARFKLPLSTSDHISVSRRIRWKLERSWRALEVDRNHFRWQGVPVTLDTVPACTSQDGHDRKFHEVSVRAGTKSSMLANKNPDFREAAIDVYNYVMVVAVVICRGREIKRKGRQSIIFIHVILSLCLYMDMQSSVCGVCCVAFVLHTALPLGST